MREEIFVGDLGTDEPFAAAALGLERVRRQALDIAAAGNRDDRLLFGIRSSSLTASSARETTCVRRSSPYFSFNSVTSSLMIFKMLRRAL